jgi:hypothetical protein
MAGFLAGSLGDRAGQLQEQKKRRDMKAMAKHRKLNQHVLVPVVANLTLGLTVPDTVATQSVRVPENGDILECICKGESIQECLLGILPGAALLAALSNCPGAV